jgi:hypothetical protein
MPMYRSFLALTFAALTGFATAVHADNDATARSTAALPHAGQSGGPLGDRLRPPHGEVRLAELRGQGELDKPCHAEEVSNQGGSNHIYCGDYKEIFGHLSCHSPAGGDINCRKDEKDDPPKATCWDGDDEQMCHR